MSKEIRIRLPKGYDWRWRREFIENENNGMDDRVIVITIDKFSEL